MALGGVRRQWKSGLLLGLGVLFFATVFVVRIGADMVDFEVNYRAGSRLLASESLYRTSDGHFMFKYFPFCALLYAPLSMLPLGAAKGVWYALTVSCSIALFVLSKRMVSPGMRIPWYLLALPPVALAKFFFRELKLGQINTLVTLLFLVMLWELLRRREATAGALWGLATALKPYGFIFLPYWVVRGRMKVLATGVASLAAAVLAPALSMVGRATWRPISSGIERSPNRRPPSSASSTTFPFWAFW